MFSFSQNRGSFIRHREHKLIKVKRLRRREREIERATQREQERKRKSKRERAREKENERETQREKEKREQERKRERERDWPVIKLLVRLGTASALAVVGGCLVRGGGLRCNNDIKSNNGKAKTPHSILDTNTN
jgi:hypothetical protein